MIIKTTENILKISTDGAYNSPNTIFMSSGANIKKKTIKIIDRVIIISLDFLKSGSSLFLVSLLNMGRSAAEKSHCKSA